MRSSRGTGPCGDSATATRSSRSSTTTAWAATTAGPRPGTGPIPDFRGDAQSHGLPFRAVVGEQCRGRQVLRGLRANCTGSCGGRAARATMHVLEPMEFHAEHHGTGPAAQEGALRRAVGCRSLGPADHLDRPELPVPRHAERGVPGSRTRSGRGAASCCGGTEAWTTIPKPWCRWRTGRRIPRPAPTPPAGVPTAGPECPGWPLDAAEARRRQQAAGPVTRRSLDLGDGVRLDLVLIPPGEFVMGSATGAEDERPLWPSARSIVPFGSARAR